MNLSTKILVALAAAALEMLLAIWVTSGQVATQGKTLHMAVLVLPFVLVVKNSITGIGATAIPFVLYFVASLLLVLFLFRERRLDASESNVFKSKNDQL